MIAKHDLVEEIVAIQGLLELAKDNYIEGYEKEGVELLQKSRREIKHLLWQIPNNILSN